MKIFIGLPIYNEEENIQALIEKIQISFPRIAWPDWGIIGVDDGSKDSSGRILDELKQKYHHFTVVHHPQNFGLGKAIQTAITTAWGLGGEIIIFMDADLTQNPWDIYKLLEQIDRGADLVIGSRYILGGGMIGVPFWRRLLSRTANAIIKLMVSLPLQDLTSGYRALRLNSFRSIKLEENGFGIQVEIAAKAYFAGLKLKEVPILLTQRQFGTSKMSFTWGFFKKYLQTFWRLREWKKNASEISKES
jgi:dolichol-phosphate mannosyltransferase